MLKRYLSRQYQDLLEEEALDYASFLNKGYEDHVPERYQVDYRG